MPDFDVLFPCFSFLCFFVFFKLEFGGNVGDDEGERKYSDLLARSLAAKDEGAYEGDDADEEKEAPIAAIVFVNSSNDATKIVVCVRIFVRTKNRGRRRASTDFVWHEVRDP